MSGRGTVLAVPTAPEKGRRERKKAATRAGLADAALTLFLERGYDDVTVAEIADAADVSVTTLFNHFPGGKPALVFDEAEAREEALVAAVRDRSPGVGVVEALHGHLRATGSVREETDPRKREQMRRFVALVRDNRSLMEHSRAMWASQETALGVAIADTSPDVDPGAAATLAHLVVDGFLYAGRQDDPRSAFDQVMHLLAHGWEGSGPAAPTAHRRPGSSAR